MNDLVTFTNEQFGRVRAVEINGESWLVGKDVVQILGYADITHAVLDHVDEEDRVNSKTQGVNINLGQRGDWLINESGVYSLIFSSKMPKAKEFKHWITSEVLPTIRKTKGYVIDDDFFMNTYFPYVKEETRDKIKADLSIMRELNERMAKYKENQNDNDVPQLEDFIFKIFEKDEIKTLSDFEKNRTTEYVGFIYIFEWGDSIKIGCSKKPYQRIKSLMRNAEYGNIKTGRVAVSQEHTNYKENETTLHKHFSSSRKGNTELFNISFEYALENVPQLVFEDKPSEAIEKANAFIDSIKSYIMPNGTI